MQGVGLVMMLVIGALAGWIAEKLTRSDHGLLTNMVIGIAGAFIGGFLADLAGVPVHGFWGALVAALFGATVLIVVFRADSSDRRNGLAEGGCDGGSAAFGRSSSG